MVRTVPPLLGAGVRFLVAGLALSAWIWLRRGRGRGRDRGLTRHRDRGLTRDQSRDESRDQSRDQSRDESRDQSRDESRGRGRRRRGGQSRVRGEGSRIPSGARESARGPTAAGRGGLRVTRREAAGAALVGVLLTFGGNGLVTLAERHIASSLAALLIASEPLVIVLIGAAIGERASRGTLVGVTVGFVGVTILMLPGASAGGSGLVGALLVLAASISWGVGSISSTRVALPPDLGVSTALQMTFGGGVMLVAGLLGGEAGKLDPAGFSTQSIAAFGYLVVFGSIVAFSAYTWLLQHVEISRVSTYAYVNPMIAVLLGWIVLGELISPTTLVGAAVIVGSVAFTVRSTRPPGSPEGRVAPDRPMVATARRRV